VAVGNIYRTPWTVEDETASLTSSVHFRDVTLSIRGRYMYICPPLVPRTRCSETDCPSYRPLHTNTLTVPGLESLLSLKLYNGISPFSFQACSPGLLPPLCTRCSTGVLWSIILPPAECRQNANRDFKTTGQSPPRPLRCTSRCGCNWRRATQLTPMAGRRARRAGAAAPRND